MNILLVSDTHGNTDKLEKLLEIFKGDITLVCHMGDYGSDLRKFESKYGNLQMVAVNGNTDYSLLGQTEQIIDISPKSGIKLRLLITHGHRFGVKRNLDRLLCYAKELDVSAVFFGHTHEDVCFVQDGIFVMNPGSLTFGRERGNTYGIVRVAEDGKFTGEIINYEG